MDYHVTPRKAALVRALLERDLLTPTRPICGVIDLDSLSKAVDHLYQAFPRHFLHAYAAKANSAPGVLAHLRSLGMAVEVASRPEFEAAIRVGFPATRIVFDSPAKTPDDIDCALSRGVIFHIDNFQELERVDNIIRTRASTSSIGIRVNPQVGVGEITSTSTATATSKFGVGLSDLGNRDRLIAAFVARPWLRTVHAHVGSQGCPLELSVAGIGRVVDLAQSINVACDQNRVATIDIGGGLPVNFASDESRPTFSDYAALLQRDVPVLFDGSTRVITEFGRSVISKAGFIVSRVEYTKVTGDRQIAITHAGAQVAARTVYQPDTWPLRISALDSTGSPKMGPIVNQDIAGPCCFAGDILAHNRPLPLLEPGDFIVVHDTGGYYFSTPYVYNSLSPIDVYGAIGLDSDLATFSLGT